MFFSKKRILLISFNFRDEKGNTGFGNVNIQIYGKIKDKWGFKGQLQKDIIENFSNNNCKFTVITILNIWEIK